MRLSHYLAALDQAAQGSSEAAPLRPLLDLVDGRRDLASGFAAADTLVHGDCKVNNLLFEQDADEVAAVIDLDTVMRGHWAWDFGDLARSAAAAGSRFDLHRFAAVAEGFVAGSGLAPDLQPLLLAPRYVTLMLAVRFLTDHLQGDRYFRVGARGENLQRARAQFDLLLAMEAAHSEAQAALIEVFSPRTRGPE